MDLVEFLLARIAEDEVAAGRIAEASCEGVESSAEEDYFRFADPTRVLAECEAKRALVLELARMGRDETGWDGIEAKVMGYLALPYADHPDYDPGWRP